MRHMSRGRFEVINCKSSKLVYIQKPCKLSHSVFVGISSEPRRTEYLPLKDSTVLLRYIIYIDT